MSARHHSRGFEDRANARPPTIQIASSSSRRMLNNRRIDLVPPRPSKLPRIQNKHHLQVIYGRQYGPNLLESLMNKGDRIVRSFVLTKLVEKWPDATPAQRDRTLRSLISPNAIYGLISSYQFEIMQQHASKVALTGTEIVDIFLGLIGAAYYKGPAATQQWLRGLFGEKLEGLVLMPELQRENIPLEAPRPIFTEEDRREGEKEHERRHLRKREWEDEVEVLPPVIELSSDLDVQVMEGSASKRRRRNQRSETPKLSELTCYYLVDEDDSSGEEASSDESVVVVD